MAEKSKTIDITVIDEGGRFNALLKRFTWAKDYDFEGISMVRKFLSNERARLMHVLKTKKPVSMYQLAKLLKRDFKSVRDDIKLLESFGLVEMVAESTGKRERLRPGLIVDNIHINIKI